MLLIRTNYIMNYLQKYSEIRMIGKGNFGMR